MTFKTIFILEGDHVIRIRTHQKTIEGALREAGIHIYAEDIVIPDKTNNASHNQVVKIQRAKLIELVIDNEKIQFIRTQQKKASEIISDLGYKISAHDLIYVNGKPGDDLPLSKYQSPVSFFNGRRESSGLSHANIRIDWYRAISVTVKEVGGQTLRMQTAARTVGEALLQAGFMIYLGDRVLPPVDHPIQPGMIIIFERAKPITIWIEGRQIRSRTLQKNVAGVLAEMNIVLIDKDYVLPDLETPVVPNMQIRVVRVKSDIEISHQHVPFEVIMEDDAELELDTWILAYEGSPGIREKRSLVTFEDNLEVKRELIADFIVRKPRPRIYKYGTKIIIRTLNTPYGPIQYWRRLRMLATSYSASTSGVSREVSWYGKTRCGQDMRFGIVAVDPNVINLKTNIYVPGYGIGQACDTGSAIIGKRIDLGYDDHNLQFWRNWVDVYLMPPIPPNINYIIK
ncbi:MAG: ubiquitin-like domain-containing protein [Methylacidiphilales bacterium]|nr:ubiquitin-like domain-containing protein [Candidatus Methylacidiphilales bacterium]